VSRIRELRAKSPSALAPCFSSRYTRPSVCNSSLRPATEVIVMIPVPLKMHGGNHYLARKIVQLMPPRHIGGHLGTSIPAFVAREVAPWLKA